MSEKLLGADTGVRPDAAPLLQDLDWWIDSFDHRQQLTGWDAGVRNMFVLSAQMIRQLSGVPLRGSDEALRALVVKLQRRVHDEAVAAAPLFSLAHWEHHADPDWPEQPDDDSYLAFENCVHPDCKIARGCLP